MTSVESTRRRVPEPDPKDQGQEKEEKKIIPSTFFYPDNHLETTLPDSSISKLCFEFQFHFI